MCVEVVGETPGGDARSNMTRQGEENITNDALDEGKLGWPQLRKETENREWKADRLFTQ